MDNDYLWGMGENQVAHLKEGTTMTTKTEAVMIEFSFETDLTRKNIIAIEKKVETARKNLDFDTTVNLFISRFSITVILTYVDSECNIRSFDKMNSILTRLINSHKQPATFGWNTMGFLDMDSAKVGA